MPSPTPAGHPPRDPRQQLPLGVPAHLVLPGGERAFVTLRNLSRHGAQVQRPGRMRLAAEGLPVLIVAINYEQGQQRQCRAHVRWMRANEYLTALGLEFDQGDPEFLSFVQALASTLGPA